MPKAPVDEDCSVAIGNDDVGLSGNIFSMEPIPKSHTVNETADNKLRLRVLPSNP